MNEKLDLKTKIGMIYSEVLFIAFIILEVVVQFSIPVSIAIIAAGVASMYRLDRICLKKAARFARSIKKRI